MQKKIYFILLFGIFLIFLTGCETENDKYSLSDKITEEIRFLEDEFIRIIENIVLEKYEGEEENQLLEGTKKVEKSINRIMVDLAAANISNDEITKLSDGINRMIIFSENIEITNYLAELNNVFSLFPNYEAKISNDSDQIFERRLKYFTVSTFLAYYLGDKELSKTQVETLETEYLEKQKGIEYVEEHKYNLNKIYLLIEELKKAIETDSRELVKEKYLLLIEEI